MRGLTVAEDLNDVRVRAFKLAESFGLDVDKFNQLWRIIVPAARARKSTDSR